MTKEKSIQAIKDYIGISQNEFSKVIFEKGEALLNGKLLFTFDYDNGGMDTLTLDYDNICSLNMDELVELFPMLHNQVYCNDCKFGNHEDCDHDNVEYPL